ncbi:MAG: rRNA maturation RNase YbeY [Chitinophagaceae bacterium]|jgi:rRNA maturation RNase YbeY|nr:rRNA maturation RNase YbeY [Chitinophagaceae bacterium]
MSKVHFSYADRQLNISNKTSLKLFIETIFKKEKKQLGSIRYVFCSDDFLLELNRISLNHDYYTDIITFDLSEPNQPIESEVYVSIDRVKENAQNQGFSFKEELCRVVFHGALHLCGYKDKKKEDILIMRKKEDYYLKLFLR